ncbi:FIST N-terminal domain-containing protein [Sulfitobacter pacificus]|uniref:FIST N-terminal domain-containing protein n=1 Tax=Sulfitobacter pacificus TaxID=1499314 RepID=UPI00360E69D7
MTLSVEAGPRVNATTVAKAPIVLTSQVPWSDTSPMNQIKQDFGSEPLSFIALFVSPRADFEEVVAEAHRLFPDTDVAACTTAGEISKLGYDEGKIIAVGFPTAGFATTSLLIEDIHDLNPCP